MRCGVCSREICKTKYSFIDINTLENKQICVHCVYEDLKNEG